MPGYILHLTAAKMFLRYSDQVICENEFLFGNLLPDTVREKAKSHFRSPKRFGKRIEYPELIPFVEKYRILLKNDSVLGYLFHLYVDRRFFKEYLPQVVTFLNVDGDEEDELTEVAFAYVKRTKEKLPIAQFFSEEFYYGDFTKMNTYLINRYQIPMSLEMSVENPGIEEVCYGDVKDVFQELESYLAVPEDAIKELRVFELEELLMFLETIAEEWYRNSGGVQDEYGMDEASKKNI